MAPQTSTKMTYEDLRDIITTKNIQGSPDLLVDPDQDTVRVFRRSATGRYEIAATCRGMRR